MIVNVCDKVIVITGSSKGIGRELAKAFAKEKAKLVINYFQSEELAKELYREILTINENCILVKGDVTKPDDVARLYRSAINEFGRVDVLINNAGVCDDNLIQMMSLEQFRKVIDVNLTGAFLCSREFSKIMINQNSGKIINVSSLKGQEGSAGQVNYSSSKAGLIGFTKSLAKELGQYNIAVNAICPGFIVTDLNRHNFRKKEIAEDKSLLSIDDCLEDLLHFIIFISSDLFNGVSGRVFSLDSRIKQ